MAAALLGKGAMIDTLRRLDGDPIEPPASKLAYARLMIRSNPRESLSTHPTIQDRIEAQESGNLFGDFPIDDIRLDSTLPITQNAIFSRKAGNTVKPFQRAARTVENCCET